MTNEIKEILDSIKEQSEEENWIQLSPEFIQPLLDYITNLQEEIIDLKDTIENKNDCIGVCDCIIENISKQIDEAVEYIENNWIDYKTAKEVVNTTDIISNDDLVISIEEIKELLDILRGDE